ncbi:protocadherin Fat 4-like [Saccoglossus kowalevskii]
MSCTDADTPMAGVTYSIIQGNSAGKFTLNLNTNTEQPAIVLANTIDYDTETDNYRLVVNAIDNGSPRLTSTTVVDVYITGSNEDTPAFGSSVPNPVQVYENTALGTVMFTVVATDADLGDDGTLVYELLSDGSGMFAIDADTATVILQGELDYDLMGVDKYYDVVIQVSDGGSPIKTDTTTVRVTVIDVNDNFPECSAGSYTETKDEGISSTVVVVAMSCTDADGAGSGYGTLSYTITDGNTDDTFEISSTGDITLKSGQSLDYESGNTLFNLIIKVSDSASVSPNSINVPVTIHVSPVNEYSPTFQSPGPSYRLDISESTSIGELIVALSVEDQDDPDHPHGQFTFTMVDPDAHPFIVDVYSGVLRLGFPLDYETIDNYDLRVIATDCGSLSNTASVSIDVLDENDNIPVCTVSSYSTAIPEDAATSTTIVDLDCSDEDSTVSGFGTLGYTIIQSPGDMFSISGGELILTNALDYETDTEYIITVTVSDQGTNANSITVPISIQVTPVNEATPTFTTTYTASITEDIGPGVSVAVVFAADSDSPTYAHGIVSYSITAGDPGNRFQVNPSSGLVTTAASIDREDTPSFTLNIHAEDGGDPAKSDDTTLTVTIVDVNDNPPVCSSTSFVLAIDETAASGDSIHYLEVTVADNGPVPLTAVIPVTINVIPVNEFAPVFSSSSDITLSIPENTPKAAIMLVSDLDREITSSYTLQVKATDGVIDGAGTPNEAFRNVIVTVTDINDNSPVCSRSYYDISLDEDTSISTNFFTLTCSDGQDASTNNNNRITYGMLSSGNDDTTFVISSLSGRVTLSKALDYDSETAKTSYLLQLLAFDQGSPSQTVTVLVNIEVTPINEHTPVFSSSSYEVDTYEDTLPGALLLQVSASDIDYGNDGVVRYTMANHAVFSLQADTGWIVLAGYLDYEDINSRMYTLSVTATDQPNNPADARSSVATVVINVLDVNDNNPVPSPARYMVEFSENIPTNTIITNILVTDMDSGQNGQITSYTIVDGNTDDTFAVDSTGEITNLKQLDWENTQKYSLVIEMKDGGSTQRSASSYVAVTITPYNEFAPVFSDDSYSFSLPENTVIGSTVFQVFAYDDDIGEDLEMEELLYSFTSNSDFAIDAYTGEITVRNALDRETLSIYSLTIRAVDNGHVTKQTTTVGLVVFVTDYNDNKPICNPSTYHTSISENTSPSSFVLQISCSDADEEYNALLSYELVAGSAVNGNPFEVDSSGRIFTRNVNFLDYESTNLFELAIYVTDGGTPSLTSTATVIVEISTYNEHAPQLSEGAWYNGAVFEDDVIGTPIVQITAIDQDSGAGGKISYMIANGNDDGKFSIDNTEGWVKVRDELDRESVPEYRLTVLAVDHGIDGGQLISTGTVVITVNDVNDNTPSCTQYLHTVPLAEDSLENTFVAKLSCSDIDDGINAFLFHEIDSTSDPDEHFYIDTNGTITLHNPLDYETKTKHKLDVIVRDGGTPSLSTVVTVVIEVTRVNEYDPVFSQPTYTFYVDENVVASTLVAEVSVTDQDKEDDVGEPLGLENGDITDSQITASSYYSESYVPWNARLNGMTTSWTAKFNDYNQWIEVDIGRIREITGFITQGGYDSNQWVTQYHVSYSEDDNAWTYYKDTTGNDRMFVGNVDRSTPVAHMLDDHFYARYVTIHPKGYYIQISMRFEIIGIKEESQFTYEILSGNNENKFYIDSESGVLFTTEPLDRETIDAYDLKLLVTDGGSPSRTSTANLVVYVNDVNDNIPGCSPTVYTAMVEENSAADSLVLNNITCVDLDIDSNSVLQYSIHSGNVATTFYIDQDSGFIYIYTAPDFESYTFYDLTIRVSDNGTAPLHTFVQVSIGIVAVNEFAPVFPGTYTVTINEVQNIGYEFIQVAASDNDRTDHEHGQVIFSITAGDNDGTFSVGAVSGMMELRKKLNREYLDVYVLTLRVTDGGGLYDDSDVTITVSDYNDNGPVFETTIYEASVSEDANVGTTVLVFQCTDADVGVNADISYSITAGNGENKFLVTSNREIQVNNALNYESIREYTLTITATDGGAGPLQSTASVVIHVDPVNEHSPVFTPDSSLTVSWIESTAIVTTIKQVIATDSDWGGQEHGIPRYSIISGNIGNVFSIAEDTGVITLAGQLDRETLDEYALTVRASDNYEGETPIYSDDVTFYVIVTDANDHYPVFNPEVYSVSVLENVNYGTVVVQLTTTDADIGSNANVEYVIVDGNTMNEFYIYNSYIRVNSVRLDRERSTHYKLLVRAHDSGSPSLSSTATVNVEVLSVNDNAPVFNIAYSSVEIYENVPLGSSVFDANAVDIDIGTHAMIVYSITGGNDAVIPETFLIDSTSGVVRIGAPLDRERQGVYDLVITAQDNFAEGFYGTKTLRVTVLDRNDNAPQLSSDYYTTTISEDIGIAVSIMTIAGSDLDSGVNAELEFSIYGEDAHYFTIGITSGELFTQQEVDYEQQQLLFFYVVATDIGSPRLESIPSAVQIFITDVNDNAPVFEPNIYYSGISESTSPLTSFLPTHAYDIDDGENGRVTYSLISSSSPNVFYFSVDPTTGVLSTSYWYLDRESYDYYELTIRAYDNGSPVRYCDVIVHLTIEDANDNSPVFTQDVYFVTIHEHVDNGTYITTVSATDADIYEHAEISYYITGGNIGDSFFINPNTGEVFAIADLDREITPIFTLVVEARDALHSDSSNISITLRDLNDNFAVFSESSYYFEFNEDIEVGTVVGTILAHDTDNGTNSELRYQIINGNENDHFDIGELNANITSKVELDRESIEEYNITVQVYDLGNIQLQNNVTVTLKLIDVNDNAPTFDQDVYEFTIPENLETGTIVFNLTASDPDLGENSRLRFYKNFILLTNDIPYYFVDRDTGVVTVNVPTDREDVDYIELRATVRDYGSSWKYSRVYVYITVSDVNDHTPVIDPSFYSLEIRYDSISTEAIAMVTAYDDDIDNNAELSYFLAEPSNVFDVDLKSGELQKTSSDPLQVRTTVTSEEGVVRIDTFDPVILVDINLEMSLIEFNLVRGSFIDSVSLLFPPGRIGISQIVESSTGIQSVKRKLLITGDTLIVSIYGVYHKLADDISGISEDKEFLSADQLLSVLRLDSSGTPAAVLQTPTYSNYSVISVQPHFPEPDSAPFWQTTYGIAILALSAVIFVLTIILIIACCYKSNRKRKMERLQHTDNRVLEEECQ